MASRRFENHALRSYWSIHVEAWQRSGVSQRAYCIQHRLSRKVFVTWLKQFMSEEEVRKHKEYLTKLCRQEQAKKRAQGKGKPRRNRYGARTDMRSSAVQAFWAMHVEAMNWSGMGLCEYASALDLSPTSLRRWRNRLEDGDIEVDWRAALHPSARAQLRPRLKPNDKEIEIESGLTAPPNEPRRRLFSAEAKMAIVLESEGPEETVSAVARRHGITTSMLFRWRAERGFGKDKRAKLASVELAGDGGKSCEALATLNDLVRPPDGMMAVELDNGRRVFAPVGSDPGAVRRYIAEQEKAS